jgi:hypothetical protein
MRSCLVTALLVFVVLPAAGLAIAAWLFLVPTASEAEAAKAYRDAPACSLSSLSPGCIKTEKAEIVSYTWIPGKCGAHYDRFTLKLTDGVHPVQIGFDCLAPNPSYALPDGRVLIREYRGQVTTVYDVNGKAYETADSPTGGSSWRGGVAALLIIFSAPILLVSLLVLRVLGFNSTWRLLKNPNKPRP